MHYKDALEPLNQPISLQQKLVHCHRIVQRQLPFVARIAVTIYDPATTVLKTYVHSSGEDDPLSNYQTRLDEAPSLKAILERGEPRIINNLLTFEGSGKEHTRRIGRQGYAASYTLPMFYNGGFFGFIFFNSRETDVFTERALSELDVFAHLISLMVIDELSSIRALTAALSTAAHITHQRDPETGSHLDRMSRYSQLIARKIAASQNLSDEFVEHVFMFAPLHDIGKVAIPDRILLKPGPLDEEERRVMATHTRKGLEIVDHMIARFNLNAIQHVEVLRNIVRYHHEPVSGEQAPELEGREVPLEARIVAVADVFDALTSARPYKDAWDIDLAFDELRRLAGPRLDPGCVQALVESREEVEDIMTRFDESRLG
ncbi:MAG TPA: HD domain-containing protein [Gammaproteobacteria bacterium]|nr:HD domain-containing protein [Gammaproteobacteria bacterium]